MRTRGELESRITRNTLQANHDTNTIIVQAKVRPILESKDKDKVDSEAKKRTLTEMQGGVSEEELEAYKRARAVADDPMAKLLGRDDDLVI